MAQANNHWQTLFGGPLTSANGEVPLTDLASKDYVGLYFSAHWCPPCKMFTPKLAEFYKQHSQSKNFEIVFVSSDRDEDAFKHYFGEMPWKALPYVNRDTKNALSKKYKVQGIPTFVLLDKHGNTVTTKARDNVMADPSGTDFPWLPKTLWELLKGNLESKTGLVDAVPHLQQTTVFGIYFSAHWCGPCRQFTPVLTSVYNKLKSEGKKFEVVFVSGDNSDTEFAEYFGSMPWTAIPFSDKKRIEELNSFFEVEGIPHFVLLDGASGKVVNKNARGRVQNDPAGKDFPWSPKPLNTVDEGASDINDVPCVILVNSGLSDTELAAYEKVAVEYAAKWKDLPEAPALFLYGKDSPMTDRIKNFTNVPDKTLFVLSIPDGSKTLQATQDFSEQGIRSFVEAYLAGSLKSKGIKE